MTGNLLSRLLLLVCCFLSARAQSNSVSVSKGCYIEGEAFVATFQDKQPKPLDWVGIIEASADLSGATAVNYTQFVYTCGTSNCTTVGPTSGTISIYNNLPIGEYKAVLLSEDTYKVLAVSSTFSVAATCPAAIELPKPRSNTVAVGKACYHTGEGVLATFTESRPRIGDIIGLIKASAKLRRGSITYPATINSCGTIDCSFAVRKGSVSIFNDLPPGQYKAVLLQGARLRALAASGSFTIANDCNLVTPAALPGTPSSP